MAMSDWIDYILLVQYLPITHAIDVLDDHILDWIFLDKYFGFLCILGAPTPTRDGLHAYLLRWNDYNYFKWNKICRICHRGNFIRRFVRLL